MSHTDKIITGAAVGVAVLIGLSSLLPSSIYSSPGWIALWVTIAGTLIFSIVKARLWRNIPTFLLHLSFLLMIAGGIFTCFLAQRGSIALAAGETTDIFITDRGDTVSLPEAVTLVSFNREYYPGMSFPKDFRSVLSTSSGDTLNISMNHIGKIGACRLYQSSFDGKGGTILAVNRDPAGITIVYSGFFLFIVAGALMVISRFRKHNTAAKAIVAAVLMSGGGGIAGAVPAVSKASADSLALRPVLFNGETVPFNTVATRLTYKLTGQSSVAGLSPEIFIASLITYKEDWLSVPFIKVKNDRLTKLLGITGEYVSVTDLYDDNGDYIPAGYYKGGSGILDKEIVKLDEKIALLMELWEGTLFTPLDSDAASMRSFTSLKAEIIYNRIVPVRALFILTVILVFVVLSCIILKKDVSLRIPSAILAAFSAGCYIWLWTMSPVIPLTDTSGLMFFLGVCVLMISACLPRKRQNPILTVLSLLCASFLLLVAWLGVKDPVMTPVMPVLASPWLSIHVSVIMLSYAVLGFTLPVSVTALIMKKERERLSSLAFALLLPGVYLLGAGIITGSIWANLSWGRYWAWDPKETWSLVTFIIYSIPLHRCSGMRQRPNFLSLYLILSFATILITYFGVNYLPSLHAYK